MAERSDFRIAVAREVSPPRSKYLAGVALGTFANGWEPSHIRWAAHLPWQSGYEGKPPPPTKQPRRRFDFNAGCYG